MRRLLILTPLVLSACADAGIGPSLAKRPIESRSMAEPVSTPAQAQLADADLQSQIDGLIDRANVGQRAFAGLLPRARAAALAAGPEGSESWIVAQQLLTALEAARAASPDALARLDAMLATRALAGDEAGLSELQAAQQLVATTTDGQNRALEELRARISR
jgi:hypothetical protein